MSQNSQEDICTIVSFLIKLQAYACNILKRDSGTGVSCEFREIFKNSFFTEHLWTSASEIGKFFSNRKIFVKFNDSFSKKKTFQTIEVSLFSRLINDLLNTIPLNVLVNINRIPTGAKHSISTYPFTNFNHKQVSQLQFDYSGWIRACIFYYIWDWFCRLATYLLTKLETNVKSQLSLSEWILGGGSNHSESGRLRPTNYVSQLTTTTYITMLTCCSNIFFLTISPSIEKPLMWLITCPTVRNTTTQQLYRSLRISITTRTFHSFSLKNSRCYQTG